MREEDLNKAIEELLENNPNGTKVYKRKRNRYKDMVKKARRNEPIIYDKIKDELLTLFMEEVTDLKHFAQQNGRWVMNSIIPSLLITYGIIILYYMISNI